MNPKKLRTPCKNCGREPYGPTYTYCSNTCQQQYQFLIYIREWKSGKKSGLSSLGTVTPAIKRYLRDKFNNQCVLCGWSKVNPSLGEVPLVADHIDGNWKNNTERNLRLLCSNCDSLTPTFSALNKGRGRPNRTVSKRSQEAAEMARLARRNRL